MPFRAPRICGCGRRVPWDVQCECERKREYERKRRAEANRPNARQRGYDSKWERERELFLRVNPTCRRCGHEATVVDHIRPHRGNVKAFWDRSNWQPLCSRCHNSLKQAQERALHAA